jgi:dGTPase
MENRFYNEWDCERAERNAADEGEYRTAFQLDRDRVIYTSAFRRLQAKTQVFLSGEYDFYRTRLTHSIEVAQIGRSLCAFLRQRAPFSSDFFVDADLVEGVCLAHDLGHPPFGHAGERTLHRLLRERFGGFEGNAQSLRIIAERIYSARETGRRGMNPTRAFLDGILKYKSLRSEMGDPRNHFLYDEQSHWREFALGGAPDPSLPPGESLNGFRSIECQIMDWADDTAYSLNDIVDGVRAGFIRTELVERWAEVRSLKGENETRVNELLRRIRERKVEGMFGRKVGDFIRACTVMERDGFLADRSNRYRYSLKVLEDARQEAALWKALSFEIVFQSAQIQQLEHKGDYVLERIFRAFEQRYLASGGGGPRLLPAHVEGEVVAARSAGEKARLICDYIAGMTDGFAVHTYKRLFDPDFGSISDLA